MLNINNVHRLSITINKSAKASSSRETQKFGKRKVISKDFDQQSDQRIKRTNMAANMSMENCTDSAGFLYEIVTEDMWTSWDATMEYFQYTPWLFSLIGSTVIGLTGIFPLWIIPIGEGVDLKTGDGAGTLKVLLSFAVGGLLGDVFLHLLPEAWGNSSLNKVTDSGHPSMACGFWVLGGFLVFVIVEKLFNIEKESEAEDESTITDKQDDSENTHMETEKEMENNNCITLIGSNPQNGFSKRYIDTDLSNAINETFLEKQNGYSRLPNGYKDTRNKNCFVDNGIKQLICNEFSNSHGGLSIDKVKNCLKNQLKMNGFSDKLSSATDISANKRTVVKEKSKHITGYLNLVANIIDNFTHGLAVGGSFLVSLRLGVLTTFAILIHEIPHEVGDFAILLRSGFNRWDAARAQLITSSGGIFGAMSAVFFSGGEVGAKTSWILPFTAGGFLHIGMVNILPELMKETSPKESLKQTASLLLGIVVMVVLTILCD